MNDPMESPEPNEPPYKPNNAQRTLAVLIVAFGLGAFLYNTLVLKELHHTAAMFIGIPALLAILLALAPRARTVTGSILRGITIALLVIAPLLGEGYLCILFASPLFYIVGLIVGVSVDLYRKRRKTTLSCIAILFLPLSLEGIVPQLTYNRAQSVTITEVIDAPAPAVEAALAHSPRIDATLPRFLRIGFPHPLEARGEGLDLGATRTIHFAGAEGDPPGDLVMRVTDHHPGHVRFTTVSDSSKLTQWVRWQTSEVTWTSLDATHTSVTWRISFDRQLDPYWYFAPWEHIAVGETAKYLITANATPAGTAR